jgi:CRP/FNR family transcriptional regulator
MQALATASTPMQALRFVPQLMPSREARPQAVPGARSACSNCRLRELCLPHEDNGEAIRALDELLLGRRRVKRGQHLYYQGDSLQFLYAVRVGCFKSAMTLADGREHVTAFAFAGEMLGFDALAGEMHTASAVALEDSEVCAIPYDTLLTQTSDSHGTLRRRMHRMLGAEMLREHYLMTLLANTNSEPRVAAFLLLVAQHLRQRGYSASEFVLRMSRAEIGSYLGLTLETVSRALSAFAHRGWLDVRKRRVAIADPQALAQLCETALPGICRNFAQWDTGSAAVRCS